MYLLHKILESTIQGCRLDS